MSFCSMLLVVWCGLVSLFGFSVESWVLMICLSGVGWISRCDSRLLILLMIRRFVSMVMLLKIRWYMMILLLIELLIYLREIGCSKLIISMFIVVMLWISILLSGIICVFEGLFWVRIVVMMVVLKLMLRMNGRISLVGIMLWFVRDVKSRMVVMFEWKSYVMMLVSRNVVI